MVRSTLKFAWPLPKDSAVGKSEGAAQHDGGLHVAIIMDGNGRWARARGKPRSAGHIAGTVALRHAVEAAPDLGISTLTLYAFSADNWRRPRAEVGHLMRLFQRHLDSERTRLVNRGVRLNVIGRRDRMPGALLRSMAQVEEQTRAGRALHLRLAIDYSARDAILAAAEGLDSEVPRTREAFSDRLSRAVHAPQGTRDVDLLIRTGGEQRLSDFLLWESAYAELYFTDVLWPDFGQAALAAAVREFADRDRRYGGLPKETQWVEAPQASE